MGSIQEGISSLFRAFAVAALGAAFSATAFAATPDCNLNGVTDSADIEGGRSADLNSNGVPDECEVQPVQFGTRSEFALSYSPRALTTADVDGDGKPDLVTARSRAALKRKPVLAVLRSAEGAGFQEQ